MNTFITKDENNNNDYFYATQINEIRSTLEALGVEYLQGGDSVPDMETEEATEETDAEAETEEESADALEPTVVPEEDNTELYDQLNMLIEEAKKPETTENKTEESIKNLDAALEKATSVWNDTESAAEELTEAKEDLQKALDGLLEKEKGLSPIVIIAIAAVLIIVIVVIVVLIITSSGRKKRREAEREKQRRAAANINGINGMNPGVGNPGSVNFGGMQQQQWNNQQRVVPPMGSDGSEETGILNDGASETTVLSGQNIPAAYLIRRKNNERITISKAIYKIGKERRRVDYCVTDNTNVSRDHADIVYRNGEFYIKDNNATNGTSINGSFVPAGQERKLNNNDIIKLADEEFQFRTF